MTFTDEPVRPDTRPYACLFPRLVILTTLVALVLGALGGVLATRVWSEEEDAAGAPVHAEHVGVDEDEVLVEEPFAVDVEEPFPATVDEPLTVDDEPFGGLDVVVPVGDLVAEDHEPASESRPEPQPEPDPEPEPEPEPEPANAPPSFDHVTVSTRSRAAALVFAARDVDGAVARVVVDWGDGTPVEVVEPPRSPLEHRYPSSLGDRFRTTVTVTAYDDRGAFTSTARPVEVVALQRVSIGEIRLTPQDDCFDVTIDLRLSGQAHLTGAIEAGDGYRASLRRGDSAVALPAKTSDDRAVDAGFTLGTSLVIDSSIHGPVALRRSVTKPGSYRSVARLAHDDAPDRICTVVATYAVTVREV